MYSPITAEPIHVLNQNLRKTVAGSHYVELSALLAGASSTSNTSGRGMKRRGCARGSIRP